VAKNLSQRGHLGIEKPVFPLEDKGMASIGGLLVNESMHGSDLFLLPRDLFPEKEIGFANDPF
jgi:hypothetical protein